MTVANSKVKGNGEEATRYLQESSFCKEVPLKGVTGRIDNLKMRTIKGDLLSGSQRAWFGRLLFTLASK